MTSTPHAAPEPPAEVLQDLVGGCVASRIAAGDPRLWPVPAGPARPGWLRAARDARPMVGAVAALGERFRVAGLHRIVLVTTAGAGVAAEALGLAGPAGTGLVVLDTPDPLAVADALAGDLDVTALVAVVPPDAGPAEVASVAAVHRVVADALRAEGLAVDERSVLVTGPDGPRLPGDPTVVAGPPDVAGLWSSLSAYALVPAGLAGIDVADALAAAISAERDLDADGPDNPALVLGALLAGSPAVAVTGPPALAGWAAELVGAGLGKRGRGPLPVRLDSPGTGSPPGALVVGLSEPDGPGPPGVLADAGSGSRTTGPAAAQVLLWQRAVAVAAHLLGVEPTEEPAPGPAPGPSAAPPVAFVDGEVAVHAGDWLPPGVDTVADALRALVDPAGHPPTHLAVHAYLDRESDASAAVLRAELARRTGLTTTFGWAPRCLVGTGRHDRAGRGTPVVCQLTGDAGDPGSLDGAAEELGGLQRAAAAADAAALTGTGRRVLRLHLADRLVGLVTLAHAVQQL